MFFIHEALFVNDNCVPVCQYLNAKSTMQMEISVVWHLWLVQKWHNYHTRIQFFLSHSKTDFLLILSQITSQVSPLMIHSFNLFTQLCGSEQTAWLQCSSCKSVSTCHLIFILIWKVNKWLMNMNKKHTPGKWSEAALNIFHSQ